jgi:hypothetical protein
MQGVRGVQGERDARRLACVVSGGAEGECRKLRYHSESLLFQDGVTPLMAATWYGHLDVVKALIEARADVIAVNKVCWQLASTHTHSTHTKAVDKVSVYEFAW